ncbi:thiolase domain-containing protein [Iamia majanohamensis]|uniref:Thiolase domain-containing protein n=1 Tax=Iamia majanohamensis TaxID=467976 RepID=A0AAE9Y5Y8_9ACTN|nr:thiolase domain-containing protein [Iamia majanohamensis]WCO66136.1 thiolase domain-containing protein [Iamia majanohamensis]
MRDVAIVSFAQSGSLVGTDLSETQVILPVITEAVERAGIERSDIGFTCSGSADYLSGTPFAFVANLEAVGAWPPISESHVDMDGAWALYEAWVRLQHGDVDVALAFSSGISSRSDLGEVLCLQNDPYYLLPLWADHVSLAALQARALIDAGLATEADLAEVAARSRRAARDNPHAQVSGDVTAADMAAKPEVVAPLRAGDVPPVTDGAAAVILVAGDRARDLCENPAWIRGIEHRSDPHYLGVRDLTRSTSARLAAEAAGVGDAPIEVAELAATFSHEEIVLRQALGLGDDVEVNPSGGPLASNPMMVSGLIRIGEAFRQIDEGGRHRTLGHATSGPCLQQNLVCVLEGDS